MNNKLEKLLLQLRNDMLNSDNGSIFHTLCDLFMEQEEKIVMLENRMLKLIKDIMKDGNKND
jgi:hypothetical protein